MFDSPRKAEQHAEGSEEHLHKGKLKTPTATWLFKDYIDVWS
jgi:hypothetical protein